MLFMVFDSEAEAVEIKTDVLVDKVSLLLGKDESRQSMRDAVSYDLSSSLEVADDSG